MRVGEVKAVRLSPDLSRVAVDARLRRDAAGLAAEGSQWWIVRPEISAGRVSGLDALLGPRYLEVHPGKGPRTVQFTGLDRPPGGGHDPQSAATGGLELVIDAPQRGSLAVDSPVVYRGIKVGSVRAMRLASKAQSIEVVIVIDGEFRSLVRANSRFWNAGGIGVDWGLIRGLQVRAGSFEALVAGAIAFATPTKPGDPVENGHRFPLADEPKDDWLTWAPPIELGK
jgi:paraquat-inducible protein B